MQNRNLIRKSAIIGSVILLLLLAISLNIIQYVQKDRIEKKYALMHNKSEALNNELRNAKTEINKFIGLSSSLDQVILEANEKIAEKERKIREMLNSSEEQTGENEKLTKEIEELREKYLNAIDSLLVEKEFNKTLNTSIQSLMDKIDRLNAKLGVAERLMIDDLTIIPHKKNSFGKTSQTVFARKTTDLEICYNILENKIVRGGNTNIYLRIFLPDGQVLTSDKAGSGIFRHPEFNIDVPFTKHDEIFYKNQTEKYCFLWNYSNSYMPGLYLVEIHTDKYQIATTTFTLK